MHMPKSYFPTKQAEAVPWALQFSNQVVANAAAFNVPTTVATELNTRNANLQEAWVAFSNPSNRTRGVTEAKTAALRDFKAFVKNVVNTVQAAPGVTDQQRLDLGITVRKTQPSTDGAPTEQPVVTVKKMVGRTVTVGLSRQEGKRGRPPKTLGANVFVSRAANPNDPTAKWEFAINTGKNTFDLPFGASATGETVWLRACWYNGAKESGPLSSDVKVDLPAGGVQSIGLADSDNADNEGMRLAA